MSYVCKCVRAHANLSITLVKQHSKEDSKNYDNDDDDKEKNTVSKLSVQIK